MERKSGGGIVGTNFKLRYRLDRETADYYLRRALEGHSVPEITDREILETLALLCLEKGIEAEFVRRDPPGGSFPNGNPVVYTPKDILVCINTHQSADYETAIQVLRETRPHHGEGCAGLVPPGDAPPGRTGGPEDRGGTPREGLLEGPQSGPLVRLHHLLDVDGVPLGEVFGMDGILP